MNPVPYRPRRLLRPAIATFTCCAVVGAAAGCGGGSGDAPQAVAPSTPFAQTTTAQTTTAASPARATTPKATTPRPPRTSRPPRSSPSERATSTPPTEPKQAYPAPPAGQQQENQLPAASVSDKLVVRSASGIDPKWRVAAQRQGKTGFCVVVTSLGASTPAPDCQSGTLLALTYFSDQSVGQASANVAQIARSVRSPPSDILVSGTASGDVTKVVIDDRHHAYVADLSAAVVSIPVDRKLARTLTGESASQLASLPNPVKLRVFGLSIPEVNGNPPTSAVAKTRHGAGGVVTLELQ